MRKHKIHTFSHVCSWLKKGNVNTSYCSTSLRQHGGSEKIGGERRFFWKRNFNESRATLCLTPVQNATELTKSLTNCMGQSELLPKHFPSSSSDDYIPQHGQRNGPEHSSSAAQGGRKGRDVTRCKVRGGFCELREDF